MSETAADNRVEKRNSRWAYFRRWFRVKLWIFRVAAGKWNSYLDKNPLASFSAWFLGGIANVAVFLTIKKDIAASIGIRLGPFFGQTWVLILLLLIAPGLGAIKKILKIIEVQDDRAKADTLLKNTSILKRCAMEISQRYQDSHPMSPEQHRAQVIGVTTSHIAAAFAEVTKQELEKIKVLTGRVEKGKLVEIVSIAPSGTAQLSTLRELAGEQTSISRCIKSKRTLTLPDISLEVLKGKNSKFVVTESNPEGGKGSLICFPVVGYKGGTVRYIVSVQCFVERTFNPADNRYYELLLGTYGAFMIIADRASSTRGTVRTRERVRSFQMAITTEKDLTPRSEPTGYTAREIERILTEARKEAALVNVPVRRSAESPAPSTRGTKQQPQRRK